MPTRPFLVMSDGECVPLEGAWRVALLRGEWYVLGHNSVVPCGSERAATSMLGELEGQTDADRLAEEAIDGLDRLGAEIESGVADEASGVGSTEGF